MGALEYLLGFIFLAVCLTGSNCQVTCEYSGFIYNANDTFPAGDGCNDCFALPTRDAVCTQRPCPPPFDCEYNDKVYVDGDIFPASDGCNTCECKISGLVECTATDCQACENSGMKYATDSCDTCTHDSDGTLACPEIACQPCENADGSLTNSGEKGPEGDKCSQCTCRDGEYDCPLIQIFECNSGSVKQLPMTALVLLILYWVTPQLTM